MFDWHRIAYTAPILGRNFSIKYRPSKKTHKKRTRNVVNRVPYKMEVNNIRNYDEITNNGVTPAEKYIFKKGVLISEEDKDSCLRLLTFGDKHLALCHSHYNTAYINSVIEDCDWLLYFHNESNPEEIVAFSLVKFGRKRKGKILDIRLLCAVLNNKKLGRMMANAVYNFAIQRGCAFMYTSPRTPLLRETFIKYGFEPICGKMNVDEVLENEISLDRIIIPNKSKTRKANRAKSNE
jgi:hypothetical protein